jgi:hypothetical protein
MNRHVLDARAARATWTILVFVAALGLAYVLRNVLLLGVPSLFFAYLLFHRSPKRSDVRRPTGTAASSGKGR